VIYCTGNLYPDPHWYVKINWGVIVVDIDSYDTSCCPVEQTGICPDQCPINSYCEILYGNQKTEWQLFYSSAWYIGNKNTLMMYRVLNGEGVK
jgi:hypothetical protein